MTQELNMVAQIALNTPTGSLQHIAACNLCTLRGLDPNHYSPSFGPPMMNWQRMIVEAILNDAIVSNAKNG